MKAWKKATICIALSLMCIFSCIGFALLSDELSISGSASLEASEPEGIYISKVEISSMNGLSPASADIMLPTSLRTNWNVYNKNATITYAITVHNKTDMTYWYLGTEFLTETVNNNLIDKTGGIIITTKDNTASNSDGFNTSDWVPPQTERTFYATYTFGSNAQGVLSTLVNFNFGFNMVSVSDGFLKVLNDKVTDYGYEYLANAFESQYKENNSTVIGNLGNDKTIFDNLFGSNITVNVDGQDLPVTILVDRKNVDGKTGSGDTYDSNSSLTGCEYTV